MTDIRDIITRVGETNAKNGFNEYPDLPPEHRAHYLGSKLMLVAGELGEAQEEIRKGHPPTYTYHPTARDGLGDVPGIHKPEGFPSEVADAVIRLFGIAYETGIDLAAIMEEKMIYNESRPYKHGKAF